MVVGLHKPLNQIANMHDPSAKWARTPAALAEAATEEHGEGRLRHRMVAEGGPSGKKGIKEDTNRKQTSPAIQPK